VLEQGVGNAFERGETAPEQPLCHDRQVAKQRIGLAGISGREDLDGARSASSSSDGPGSSAASSSVVELLSTHVRDFGSWGDEGWPFGVGGLLHRNSAGHLWRATRKLVGMRDFTLHSLRHFYASGLIAAGCDVVTVQHALGHSTPTITLDTYSHPWPRAEDRTRRGGLPVASCGLRVPTRR